MSLIKVMDRYGKEIFFGILYVSLAHISREIAPFKCGQGKILPDLPTLSLSKWPKTGIHSFCGESSDILIRKSETGVPSCNKLFHE